MAQRNWGKSTSKLRSEWSGRGSWYGNETEECSRLRDLDLQKARKEGLEHLFQSIAKGRV